MIWPTALRASTYQGAGITVSTRSGTQKRNALFAPRCARSNRACLRTLGKIVARNAGIGVTPTSQVRHRTGMPVSVNVHSTAVGRTTSREVRGAGLASLRCEQRMRYQPSRPCRPTPTRGAPSVLPEARDRVQALRRPREQGVRTWPRGFCADTVRATPTRPFAGSRATPRWRQAGRGRRAEPRHTERAEPHSLRAIFCASRSEFDEVATPLRQRLGHTGT